MAPSDVVPADQEAAPSRRAAAHPTKAFFVRMLTKDISLEDCLLDLVDNSIDAAWSKSQATPTDFQQTDLLKDYRIDITVSSDSFEISDNCGGIALDDAVDYAFTFGRREVERTDASYSVGVYGIGMKRAVFKLGNDVSVYSTPAGETQSFLVPIDVTEWLENTSTTWDFDIHAAAALSSPGVKIVVEDLYEETASEFSDPGFVDLFQQTLERDYMLPLMHGLTITLNGKAIAGWLVTFVQNDEFSPMRERYFEGDVSVEIIAGMASSPPDTTEASDTKTDTESGWYVLCNGRVVVAADRTALTVWGRDRFPIWHPQYSGFIGIVLFTASDASLLPMTTTKRSVDTSPGLYKRAATRMQKPTRAWIDYTNAWKRQRSEAKEHERAAKPVAISDVVERKTIKLPKGGNGPQDANVLYTVPKSRVEMLGSAFGKPTMPYKEVGERSFEYAFERLVDEEE